MHRITVVLHAPVDDDHPLVQLDNFHLLHLANMGNLDMEPFPVYCNRFVPLTKEVLSIKNKDSIDKFIKTFFDKIEKYLFYQP